MREQVHSVRLDVRLHPALLDKVAARASDLNMNKGEAVRTALRQFVGEDAD